MLLLLTAGLCAAGWLLGLFDPSALTALPDRLSAVNAARDLPTDDALLFLDVGQGDATLILSKGEAVLIDGGPGTAEDGLIQLLRGLGIEHFRAIVATHPHEDHIGGLDAVLNTFGADALFLPDAVTTTVCFEQLLDAAERSDAAVYTPNVGETLLFGAATLTFLTDGEGYEELNNTSLVTRLDTDELSVLLMGDAEAPVEQALLEQGAALSCDLVKLGHHGSATSSTEDFLRATGAQTAIISCARVNDYGHPAPATLEALDRLDITPQYTYDGAVVYALEDAKEDAA